MKKTKMDKGITLVALIITIVVLLILAVVAITAITNDNIINYANNAAEGYKNEKGLEEGKLGGYEDVLSQYSNQLATGGIGGGGSSSGGTTTPQKGDLVTVNDKDGVSHEFYVLEYGDTTSKLFAKQSINTFTFTQSGANLVSFSTTNYWAQIEGISYPYNVTGVTENDIAVKAASDYGSKFEGATGRLMYQSEAVELVTNYKKMLIGNYEDYWLATVKDENDVYIVSASTGDDSGVASSPYSPNTDVTSRGWMPYGQGTVRPVVFVPTSAISK